MTKPVAEAAAAFDPRAWLSAGLIDKAVDLGAALLIMLVGWWLARRLVNLVDRALQRMQAEDILRGFVRNAVFAALMVVVVIASDGPVDASD